MNGQGEVWNHPGWRFASVNAGNLQTLDHPTSLIRVVLQLTEKEDQNNERKE